MPLPRFTPGKGPLGTHCTRGWVGPRAGLHTEVREKIICPCRGSNLDRPVVQSLLPNRSPSQTQKRGPSKYEAVVLTNRPPRQSVNYVLCNYVNLILYLLHYVSHIDQWSRKYSHTLGCARDAPVGCGKNINHVGLAPIE
jgi:hypothetical protein